MANPEHLAILKKGVDHWNKWREKNPAIKPDLTQTDLNGADLSKANLSGADLSKANLSGANLSGADLSKANLSGAILIAGNLRRANLSGAILIRAILFDANLSGADLSKATLRLAELSGANLRGADLSEADLSEADLSRAILSWAILTEAKLQQANLIDANLENANLTWACLWETQKAGWNIKGIICESVYWDREGKKPTEYKEGMFEQAHSDIYSLEIEDQGSMHPLELAALPMIVMELENKNPDLKLHIRTITDVGGRAKIKISVNDTLDRTKEEIEKKMEEMKGEIIQKRASFSKLLGEKENLKQLTTTLQKDLNTILHPEQKRYEDMAVLFLDLKGFSQMNKEDQEKAVTSLWTLAAGIREDYNAQFRKTWGDAIFCAFDDVNDSLMFACKLIQILKVHGKTSRIGMSYGQFLVKFDSFTPKLEIVDAELSKAARLESSAEVNEVLSTEELRVRLEIDHSRFKFMEVERKIEKAFAHYSIGDIFKCYRVELKNENSG